MHVCAFVCENIHWVDRFTKVWFIFGCLEATWCGAGHLHGFYSDFLMVSCGTLACFTMFYTKYITSLDSPDREKIIKVRFASTRSLINVFKRDCYCRHWCFTSEFSVNVIASADHFFQAKSQEDNLVVIYCWSLYICWSWLKLRATRWYSG